MLLDWTQIDTVLLDMDGTLLDLNFDTHFWCEHLPGAYARKHNMSLTEAKDYLVPLFRAREGTINWYCVDFWTDELGMDVALLKEEVDHLIAVFPYVTEFLDRVRDSGRRAVLVTNAHQKSLQLKMQKTPLASHLDALISAHEFGMPKEAPEFWDRLQQREPFQAERTLFIDDSLGVLCSARNYGIRHILAVRKPDSTQAARNIDEFAAFDSFAEIMPEDCGAPKSA